MLSILMPPCPFAAVKRHSKNNPPKTKTPQNPPPQKTPPPPKPKQKTKKNPPKNPKKQQKTPQQKPPQNPPQESFSFFFPHYDCTPEKGAYEYPVSLIFFSNLASPPQRSGEAMSLTPYSLLIFEPPQLVTPLPRSSLEYHLCPPGPCIVFSSFLTSPGLVKKFF